MQVIETRLLYYFLTVARERNITNAAKTLHITQPTLSRQMALLEEEVGAKLFIRDSRPLSLTDEGLLFRRRAEEILELLEKAQAEIRIHEEQIEGIISVGCGEIALKSVYLIATRDLSNLWLQFFLSQNQGFMRLFEKTVLK